MKKLTIDYTDMTTDDLADMEYDDLPPRWWRMTESERETAMIELAQIFGGPQACDNRADIRRDDESEAA